MFLGCRSKSGLWSRTIRCFSSIVWVTQGHWTLSSLFMSDMSPWVAKWQADLVNMSASIEIWTCVTIYIYLAACNLTSQMKVSLFWCCFTKLYTQHRICWTQWQREWLLSGLGDDVRIGVIMQFEAEKHFTGFWCHPWQWRESWPPDGHWPGPDVTISPLRSEAAPPWQ